MAEPQTCNNSIKLTFLCFHKVRHTQGHPLEFLTHSKKTNIAVKVRTAAYLLGNHRAVPDRTPSPLEILHYKISHLHPFIRADGGEGIGGSAEATAAGPKRFVSNLFLAGHVLFKVSIKEE